MKLPVVFISGALIVAGVAGAIAHGGATGIVKERMDAMSSMGKVVKSLSAMMRGETDYDAETVREGAEIIQSHAGETMTRLFPEGTGGGASEAKPGIWSDWEEFSSLSDQLKLFATALARSADNGFDPSVPGAGMPGQGTMMGQGAMMGQSGMMGQGGMMGGAAMMGEASGMADPEMLAQMPVQGLFNMTAQTCSSCHTKFRIEKK